MTFRLVGVAGLLVLVSAGSLACTDGTTPDCSPDAGFCGASPVDGAPSAGETGSADGGQE